MAAAAVASSLRPSTSQVEFTARPALRTGTTPPATASRYASNTAPRSSGEPHRPSRRQHAQKPEVRSAGSVASSINSMAPDPKLSVIEIEALLREKVRSRCGDLVQGFHNYDRDGTNSITRGEFRRVLEAFCLGLTTEQFNNIMNKVDTNPNGTVRYNDFLDKFYGKNRPAAPGSKKNSVDRWVNPNNNKFIRPQSPKEVNTDFTEKQVREHVHKNLKNVIKALRLYDYNRDGHVQKHELRKVLENYCFKMSDQQFNKFYQRYDFHHRGVINYKEFLTRLGISVDKGGRPIDDKSASAALNWQQPQPDPTPARPSLKKPDDSAIKGMDIEHIEMEFRARMQANYPNLKRMFIALDKHMDGFIAIEDLVSVLNHFTFAMTEQLFHQLMERFGIKASGKISWEFFLEKFQDPQSHGNGQTITIKPSHKFFPIRGAEESKNMSEIVRLLDYHVKNAYSSFKHAFLQIDKNRDGKITRKELKKIMEGFKFRMKDAQFKELFDILDPEHTNFISYHRFLDLFEPKESIRSHKWLQSCHRYNDKQKPTVMAWKTVEEILRDRIQDYWPEVSGALVSCDVTASGKVYPTELRRILEKYCLPVSDEHFTTMMQRFSDSEDGKVGYVDFLVGLGVTVSPGDLEGLSTQIQDGSNEAEQKHRDDQHAKQEQIVERALGRTTDMTVDEVIVRIKDRMSQHQRDIHKSFKMFDRSGKGKVSKKDFRAVLESHGIFTSDAQFKELCSRLQFHNGHMSFMDFVTNFEDLRVGGPHGDLNKINNHRVNPIRGDEFGLSAIEVESKLRKKLRENFEDLRGAFYKFDDNHTGNLTKSAFRRMLDAFMIRMADDEFNKLCETLGVNSKTKLSYRDFLEKFEIKDSIEGHKWLFSDHRYNDVKEMSLMSAENIHEILAAKAHRNFQDLAKAFRTMDYSSTGVINKKDLREVLYKFMLPVSKSEFNRLWSMYDLENKGAITHQDFLQRVTGNNFAPGDRVGQSNEIIQNSMARLQKHHDEQLDKQERITLHQAEKAAFMKVDTVLQQLKDRIREQYKDFKDAFRKYDKKNKGYLSVADIQRVLVDFSYFLNDDQFFDLLNKIGVSTTKSKLSYEDFLKAFEEGRKDNYKPKPADVSFPQHEFDHLSPEQAEEKLRKRIAAQMDTIQAALQAFDKKSSGYIQVSDFRRLMDNFCFRLTDKQFKHIKAKLNVNADGSLDYTQFLEAFKDPDPETDPRKWLDTIQKRLADDGPRDMTMDEVHETLKELVTARFYNLASAFAEMDYAKIGVVSKDDFREVLNKVLLRLSDEQFDRLWSVLRVNEFGNLEYQDFLDHYTVPAEMKRPATTSSGRRPVTSDFSRPQTTDMGRRLHTSSGRPVTPLQNAESVEDRVRDRIRKHWKDIQKQCRSIDTNNCGHVSQEEFKGILSHYKLDLSHDDIFKLLLKYDLHNNSRFCYPEFLKHFIINLSGGSTGLETGRRSRLESRGGSRMDGRLSRQKMGANRLTVKPLREHPANMEDAVERVGVCVSAAWKEMRKDFKQIDPAASGLMSVDDFRDVLRRNNVNLAEDEFEYIASQYSRGNSVNYNDFIKDFLRTG